MAVMLLESISEGLRARGDSVCAAALGAAVQPQVVRRRLLLSTFTCSGVHDAARQKVGAPVTDGCQACQ